MRKQPVAYSTGEQRGEGPEEHEAPPLMGVLGVFAGNHPPRPADPCGRAAAHGIGDALSGDTAKLRVDLHGLGVGGVLITLILALAHVVDLVSG